MPEQKPLANAVSPTVLQSNGICSLLTSVTFNPVTPSKLLEKLISTGNTTSLVVVVVVGLGGGGRGVAVAVTGKGAAVAAVVVVL